MSVLYNPAFTPTSMYRPVQWVLQAVSANPVEIAIAEVYIGGALIDTIKKSPLSVSAPNYFFAFDVQDVIQRIKAPLSTAKTTVFDDNLNAAFNSKNADCYGDIYLSVTYLYRDPTTNQLTDLGVTDVTATAEAILSTRQQWETMSLTDYICVLASSAGEFLTNQPQPYRITTTENLFLTFLPYQSNAFQVVTFDSNLATIDTGVASLLSSTTYAPQTLGVGLTQLAGVTWISGSVTTTNPNIAGYIITIGQWVGTFIANSVPHIYNITSNCGDRQFRIHFLNRLGGGDAYTFNNKKTRKESAKSSTAQKALTWGFTTTDAHYIYNRGKFKFDAQGERSYVLESQIYDEDTAEWLAELIQSPETYLETPEGLLPILIEDASIDISDTAEFKTLSITVREANGVIIART